MLDSVLPRWYLLLIAGIAAAVLGAWAASQFWTNSFTVSAQLIRYETPVAADSFRPQMLGTQTLVSMIKSPELLQKVGAQMNPVRSANEVGQLLKIVPQRDSDVITIQGTGEDPNAVVNAVNLFTNEAMRLTQDAQRKEANQANNYVAQQLAANEADLATVRQKMLAVQLNPRTASLPGLPTPPLIEKVEAAQDELAALLSRYTDAHPLVREQKARVAALTEQLSRTGLALPVRGGAGATAANSPQPVEDLDFLRSEFRSMDSSHSQLVNRQRAIQAFLSNPPGYFRVLAPAAEEDVIELGSSVKIGVLAFFCGILGVIGMAAGLLGSELMDDRLKTGADVKRVTRLPLLATLGDLGHMSPAAQDNWAFRTWTALQRRLSVSPNHGMVCGIISANHGDGRSTWINLLARAANQRGFRVLTIATQSGSSGKLEPVVKTDKPGKNGGAHASGNGAAKAPVSESTALTANVLSSPKEVAEKLSGPNSQPMVHIPLPGWVWSLERRKQWMAALNQWRKIDNIVILVELPPASMPESVLLAENLPNLIWLARSGHSDATETRTQLETLRHARCNLVGSVLNRESAPPVRRRFTRWTNAVVFLATLGLAHQSLPAQSAPATEASAAAERTGAGSFSVTKPQRAAWQQRLTLGPGDVLNLSLFGQPELTREEVPVGPDGRISYLEAQNVMATGLTVDELRTALNEELGKFRRAPQAFVIPVAYRSKRFYALGAVVQKGVFPLERPLTIIEAVGLAKGLETGLDDRNMVDLADFSQSFLARGGKKVPIDFEKLFLEGDLSQNVPIEPGDYLYFPTANRKEVYVLGEVFFPGVAQYTAGTTALAAVADRGGFNERAWKKRLLVVRGSLERPESFIIDASEVLAGRAPDLRLKPKDIIYVSHRPWIKAEELLDLAATAFVESAVITYTGLHVTASPEPEPTQNPDPDPDVVNP